MGLYDRDYYREPTPNWWDRSVGHQATLVLIVIVAIVFLAQLMSGDPRTARDPLQDHCDFYVPAVLNGEVWRLVTANFVQPGQSFLLLVMSLLVLYWAGSEMETIYGSTRFIAYFIVVGVVISLAKLAVAVMGFDPNAHTGGIAAPVLAVLVLFACHFPYRTILLMFVIPVPIWLLTTLITALYTLSLVGGGIRQNVIGILIGVVFALIYHRTGGRLLAWIDNLSLVSGQRRQRLRIYEQGPPRNEVEDEEPVSAPSNSSRASATGSSGRSQVDEHLEAQLDEVLEKMAHHGAHSLTAEENAILHRASEAYKRRRQ